MANGATEEDRPRSALEQVTLAGILRSGGERLGRLGRAIPREIAASYQDLANLAIDNPYALGPLAVPTLLTLKERRDRARGAARAARGDTPSIGPTGYAEHSGDLATQAGAMLFDPANLLTAGTGGVIKKVAPKVAALREKVADVVPKAIQKMGASKEAREASAARRAAEAAELEAPVGKAPRTAEERAAVPPEKYRTMFAEQGEEAVMEAARRGEHIRPAPSGVGYTGFPRHVTTPKKIEAMRGSLDQQLADAQEALAYAEDPRRVGNWYERTRRFIAESTEPKDIDRASEMHAAYSAGVSPENELAFALKHGQSRAIGAPQRAFRGVQQELLDQAVAAGVPAEMAPKIGAYAMKINPRVTARPPTGTNDFRAAQTFGYTLPSGEPWSRGVTDVMHPVMDQEFALMVDRARRRGQQMTGETAQEYPWVLGKGEDLYLQGKFKGATELESKVNALREANKTIADYAPKHTFTSTYEMTPGERVGHRPDILAAPFEAQREYGRGIWMRAPTGEDPHARDILYSATGMRQMPPVEAAGSWMGKQQPMTMARPLVYSQTGKVMELTPEMQATLQAIERLRGVSGAQAAVAGNLPVTLKARTGKSRILAERMGMNEIGNPMATPPSAEEMAALEAAAGRHGYDVTATTRGALLMPQSGFRREAARPRASLVGPMPGEVQTPKQLMSAFEKGTGAADIEAALPGATTKQAAQEGFYLPALVPERRAGLGVSTARVLRDLAAAPPAVAEKLAASPEVRTALMTQALRDYEAAGKSGVKIREDLQRFREFFAKEDFDKVVALMRKGMKPLAAMSALGFSLKGMAAPEESPR